MSIKYVVKEIVSKRDVNGNRYFAFQIWNTKTGQMMPGTTDTQTAIENAFLLAGIMPEQFLILENEINKREFRSLTREWKHYLQSELEKLILKQE